MGRLNEVIHNMKDDFIVVHLHEPCSFCREYVTGTRYYHPCPPSKAVRQERTFEGISLETPGSQGRQTTSLTRFSLCERCYTATAQGLALPGIKGGLPAGVALGDLIATPVAPFPVVTDPNPQIDCEIFDTRQVCVGRWLL